MGTFVQLPYNFQSLIQLDTSFLDSLNPQNITFGNQFNEQNNDQHHHDDQHNQQQHDQPENVNDDEVVDSHNENSENEPRQPRAPSPYQSSRHSNGNIHHSRKQPQFTRHQSMYSPSFRPCNSQIDHSDDNHNNENINVPLENDQQQNDNVDEPPMNNQIQTNNYRNDKNHYDQRPNYNFKSNNNFNYRNSNYQNNNQKQKYNNNNMNQKQKYNNNDMNQEQKYNNNDMNQEQTNKNNQPYLQVYYENPQRQKQRNTQFNTGASTNLREKVVLLNRQNKKTSPTTQAQIKGSNKFHLNEKQNNQNFKIGKVNSQNNNNRNSLGDNKKNSILTNKVSYNFGKMNKVNTTKISKTANSKKNLFNVMNAIQQKNVHVNNQSKSITPLNPFNKNHNRNLKTVRNQPQAPIGEVYKSNNKKYKRSIKSLNQATRKEKKLFNKNINENNNTMPMAITSSYINVQTNISNKPKCSFRSNINGFCYNHDNDYP